MRSQRGNKSGMGNILCIGSVHWDMIGRTTCRMRQGSDMPGRIVRRPGGVALNVAMALLGFGLRPVLLSAVGRDREGDELLDACAALGIETKHVRRVADLPTDRYMAVENDAGLIAAIADAHTLETAGTDILAPLRDGSIGASDHVYEGVIALDGNLTSSLLNDIAGDTMFSKADLRIAPASPGKADRLAPFLIQGRGTIYANLEEARLLCGRSPSGAAEAAEALLSCGARRAIVTDGARTAADATRQGIATGRPPRVEVARVTGAGDMFMAAHIYAEVRGAPRDVALARALEAAATYIAGDVSP